MDGTGYVEALPGAVGEAGEGTSGRAMGQGEADVEGDDAGGEEVQGHPDLGAEAGRDAGQGFQGRNEEGPLPGEWFLGDVAERVSGRYGPPGVALYQAETAADRSFGRRKGRDGCGMLLSESLYQAPEVRGRGAEVRVQEQDGVGGA